MADPLPPTPTGKGQDAPLIRYLTRIDEEADGFVRDRHKVWEENIRQVKGDQWRLKRSPYFMANIIKNQLRRKVSTLTESKPQIQVRARRPNLDKASAILYNTGKSIFDKNSSDDALYRVAQFAMTMGCSFMRVPYNKLTEEIELSFIDPRRVRLDPMITAAADLDKAQYIRLDTVLPLHEIRTSFPGRGTLVVADERLAPFASSMRGAKGIYGTLVGDSSRPYRSGSASKVGAIPRATIKEYWIRDPQMNTDGALLFPGGRHTIRCGDVILVDEPNPYLDGGWDLEMFEWDVDFETPYGLDEIQDLRRIQESLNRIGDSWVHNLLLGANFRVIADLDALDPDQWDKLDNEAGLIIRKKPNRQLEYQPPVPADPATPQYIEGLIRLCDLLTGNSDAQGKSAVEGSAALEGLQMARQTLVRAVARRMESMLERVGQKLISRIFQFYTSDRVLFQMGPSRDWIAYTYERQRLLEDDNGKTRDKDEMVKMYRDFKFMVSPLSSLALTRVQRTLAALQMRSATGVAPSIRRILEESDMGDPEELMREGLEELSKLPAPPPAKGRGGKK